MPIFEFICRDCNDVFEEIIFNENEEKEVKCKKCDGSNVKKLMSAGAIRPDGIPTGRGGFAAPSCGGGGRPG
ncbi:MAG: FmdB family transcriptional regulator [Deltaproteobacteria bacterium]|nr:MAG: FmdB family transcriptional regulator [Deltaproteobacteria bacterium]